MSRRGIVKSGSWVGLAALVCVATVLGLVAPAHAAMASKTKMKIGMTLPSPNMGMNMR